MTGLMSLGSTDQSRTCPNKSCDCRLSDNYSSEAALEEEQEDEKIPRRTNGLKTDK